MIANWISGCSFGLFDGIASKLSIADTLRCWSSEILLYSRIPSTLRWPVLFTISCSLTPAYTAQLLALFVVFGTQHASARCTSLSVTGLRNLADSEGGACTKAVFEPDHICSLNCDKILSRGSACSYSLLSTTSCSYEVHCQGWALL